MNAEEIVRALAKADPSYVNGHGDYETACVFCALITPSRPTLADHDIDCPWRQANEWVAENPEFPAPFTRGPVRPSATCKQDGWIPELGTIVESDTAGVRQRWRVVSVDTDGTAYLEPDA